MTTTDELRQMPLHGTHGAAGARMMPLAGWAVPAHYGDPEAEYLAATKQVVVMDASFLTVVTGRGKDHLEYLNRRLSQRVIEQAVGEGQRANQLNGEGRMEADLALYRAEEDLSFLIAPPAASGEYLQALADKYVFTEDAVFEDRTAEWGALAVMGPGAAKLLREHGLALPLGKQIAPASVGEVQGWILSLPFFRKATVLLLPADQIEQAWKALVEEGHADPLGFLAFDTIRVEEGLAWWGMDLEARTIPLEANLMDAIHTNKGCYPGQETIAKILNLGHPARALVGVLWEGEDPLPAGTELTTEDGSKAGTLTSSTYSPRLKRAIGLAMVRWNLRTVGTRLKATQGGGGKVVALPFA